MKNRQACAPRLIFYSCDSATLQPDLNHKELAQITLTSQTFCRLSGPSRITEIVSNRLSRYIACQLINHAFTCMPCRTPLSFLRNASRKRRKCLTISGIALKKLVTPLNAHTLYIQAETQGDAYQDRNRVFFVSLLFNMLHNTHKRAHTVAHTHKHIIYTYIYMRT